VTIRLLLKIYQPKVAIWRVWLTIWQFSCHFSPPVCALNASPVDGTDIIRINLTIGRIIYFPLNIHEFPLPIPINNPTQIVIEYIRYLGRDVILSRELLTWITGDWRKQHHERTNMKHNLIQYKVGSIVMGRVVEKNNRKHDVVQKLVYQSKGHFSIEEYTGFKSFLVRPYGKPDCAKQIFLTGGWYLLPPQVLLCEYLIFFI